MVKHNQTIRRLLSVLDHFVGLALKGLSASCCDNNNAESFN